MPSGPSVRLSPEQIGMVAWNAGIRDEPTLTRAIAVALAESDGNPYAHNTNSSTGDNSYGLWQINMIGAMGPERRRLFDISSNDALFDPQQNAHAMYKLSNGGKNWSPWSAFKNGSYIRHIETGKKTAADLTKRANDASPNPLSFLFPKIPGLDQLGNAVGNVKDRITSGLDIGGAISEAFKSFNQSLFRMGLNAGTVILAVVLLILGIVILLRAPLARAAKTAAGVAENVSPGGKIASNVSRLQTRRMANETARINAATKLQKAREAAAKAK